MRALLAAGILTVLMAGSRVGRAAVPQSISVQGVLRDSTGKLQSMAVNVQVNFFDAQTNGNMLATEPLAMNVMAVNGLFSVTINDAALAGKLYGSTTGEVWLELSVGNDTYARQQVTSNVFALQCAQADDSTQLGGKDASLYVSSAAPTAAGQLLISSGANAWAPSAAPSAAGMYLRSTGAGTWGLSSGIPAGDVPALSFADGFCVNASTQCLGAACPGHLISGGCSPDSAVAIVGTYPSGAGTGQTWVCKYASAVTSTIWWVCGP